jgi:uncharacterized protein (DUF433 family)
VPLYTVGEAARFLGVPPSTFGTWARGYTRHPTGHRTPVIGKPVITAFEARRGDPEIPFVGLAEAMVLAGMRRAGVSLQHIRRAVDVLESEIGFEHALASRRLYTDGAQLLFDYSEKVPAERLNHLTVVVSGQRVFADVIRDYLLRISYADDGLADRVVLPMTDRQLLEVDPRRSFGQPIFLRGGVRYEDVVDRWRAGEPLAEVAADFAVPIEDVEDVLRATYPMAA